MAATVLFGAAYASMLVLPDSEVKVASLPHPRKTVQNIFPGGSGDKARVGRFSGSILALRASAGSGGNQDTASSISTTFKKEEVAEDAEVRSTPAIGQDDDGDVLRTTAVFSTASSVSTAEGADSISGTKGPEKMMVTPSPSTSKNAQRVTRGRKSRKEERATAPKGWDGWKGSRDAGMGALEEELRGRGLPKQKLQLRAVAEGGRGLVARERIGKGEPLLFIPQNLLITAATVYSCPRIGALLKQAGVPEWPAIAVFLLSEVAQGEGSQWRGYVNALPQSPGCILQWSLGEVEALLCGSPSQRRAIECIADVTDTFSALDTTLFQKNREVFPSDVFTLGSFKWGFAVLFSRLVRLPSLGGQVALVPWADMLNHRCEVEAYLDFDKWRNAVVFKTDRVYEAGQQVYASYGPRSNGDLLLAYGIVPRGANPHNSVELVVGVDPTDPRAEEKLRILQGHRLSSPMAFPIRMEGLPVQLLSYASLVVAPASAPVDVLASMAASAASALPSSGSTAAAVPVLGGLGRKQQPPQMTTADEIAAKEVVLASCQVALEGYGTTLEEDEALLSQVPLDSFLEDEAGQRSRAAAALRASEKKILFRAEFVLRSELRQLRLVEKEKGGEGAGTRVRLGNTFRAGKRTNVIDNILDRIVRP
eukprot:TRINITY_DN968_c0_g1_i2.p1 TRINITY_DN968_c0_g1~~TRINITY_DN968_c0_g1_i2.p1  ORF type:complete len:650 (-),score=199.89 TRINITY_DN968_c0_g1_i2:262-2211(-)